MIAMNNAGIMLFQHCFNMEMVIMSRKQVTVRMDGEVWEQFKEFVTHKRERFKGVAGEEVEEALKQYMMEADWPNPDLHRETDHQDTLDRHQRKETHTPAESDRNPQKQTSETDAYIASIKPEYVPVMAELKDHKEIRRKDFEGILTRQLHLTTDKSRREHLKTFEHLHIVEPHPKAGYKILSVNHDLMNDKFLQP
jgi:hypothetical protein